MSKHTSPTRKFLREYNTRGRNKQISSITVEQDPLSSDSLMIAQELNIPTDDKMQISSSEGDDSEDNDFKETKKAQKKNKKIAIPKKFSLTIKFKAPQMKPIEPDLRSLFDASQVKKRDAQTKTISNKHQAIHNLTINNEHVLHLLAASPTHPGFIYSMCLSEDAEMLATVSTIGSIRIFDTDSWELIQELRDVEKQAVVENSDLVCSPTIEEYYCVHFLPTGKHLAVGGKCKDRYQWDEQDDDNKILPCPIKIFDITQPDAPVQILKGHTEEVLCITSCYFDNTYYLVSGSYDGSIRKWKMKEDTWSLDKSIEIMDGISNVVLSISFVPHTGNKYFVAACDDKIKLYDFEHGLLLQEFESGYESYCDLVQFVPYPGGDASFALLTRGSELVDNQDTQLHPNKCRLFKFSFPKQSPCYIQSELINHEVPAAKSIPYDKFDLECIQSFSHEEYKSNFWMVKTRLVGNYLFAPTMDGRVFIYSVKQSSIVAVLSDHGNDTCVRDVCIFEKGGKLFILTCGDDSTIKIYTQ